MRTSYFRRRSAFFTSKGRVIAVLAAFIFSIALIIRFVWPGVFFALSAPLFNLGNAVSDAAEDPDGLKVRADRALTNENLALATRIEELENLLGDAPEREPGIVAGVIARPPLAPYDSLIIGAGEKAGVAIGMLVSADGGVPVGTVETVTATQAHVSLFSSAERATEGWAGEDRLPITLIGEGGGAFSAEVPRDAGLVEGAVVYVPGPGPRPVGRIVRIDAQPSSPSARIRIEPLANIFSLTTVLVGRLP